MCMESPKLYHASCEFFGGIKRVRNVVFYILHALINMFGHVSSILNNMYLFVH